MQEKKKINRSIGNVPRGTQNKKKFLKILNSLKKERK